MHPTVHSTQLQAAAARARRRARDEPADAVYIAACAHRRGYWSSLAAPPEAGPPRVCVKSSFAHMYAVRARDYIPAHALVPQLGRRVNPGISIFLIGFFYRVKTAVLVDYQATSARRAG